MRAFVEASVVGCLLAVVGLLAPGCETYTERISCSNGTVLNDDGDCVAPPVPDGGVSIPDCATLCAMIPDWTETEVMCLQGNLSRFMALPSQCEVLETTAQCEACVTAAGADDTACSLSASCL